MVSVTRKRELRLYPVWQRVRRHSLSRYHTWIDRSLTVDRIGKLVSAHAWHVALLTRGRCDNQKKNMKTTTKQANETSKAIVAAQAITPETAKETLQASAESVTGLTVEKQAVNLPLLQKRINDAQAAIGRLPGYAAKAGLGRDIILLNNKLGKGLVGGTTSDQALQAIKKMVKLEAISLHEAEQSMALIKLTDALVAFSLVHRIAAE